MACQPAVQWNNLVEYIWFFDLIWHLFGISSSKMSYYSFSIFVAECFVHPFFCFWVTFGNDAMKIRKYKVIFVYILQGKMGKTEKNGKKITQLKGPKYQETIVWDEWYIKLRMLRLPSILLLSFSFHKFNLFLEVS